MVRPRYSAIVAADGAENKHRFSGITFGIPVSEPSSAYGELSFITVEDETFDDLGLDVVSWALSTTSDSLHIVKSVL